MPFKRFLKRPLTCEKTIQKTENGLTDGVQNCFYLHSLSSWLDLADKGCMKCISNQSLQPSPFWVRVGGLSQGKLLKCHSHG